MDQSQQRLCNKCYEPLGANVRFCGQCGAPAPQKVIGNCPNCGGEIMDGQTTCYLCGTWVAEAFAPKAEEKKPKKVKKPIPTGVWMSLLAVLLVAIVAVAVVLLLQPRNADAVELEKSEVALTPGERVRLEYEVLPENTPDKSVTWQSDDEAVAKVKNGEVVAVDVGVCQITVTTVNGHTDSCTVTVSAVQVASMELSETEVTLFVKDRLQLACTVLPAAAETVLTWSSSDPDVCQVEEGLLKAKDLGSCTITVTAANGVTAQCQVTVALRMQEKLPLGQWELVAIENRFEETSRNASGATLSLQEDLSGLLKQDDGDTAIRWWYVNQDGDGDYWYDVEGFEDEAQVFYAPESNTLTLYMADENWVFKPAE